MKNKERLNIVIESGAYTGPETGPGTYLYNLVKSLSVAEKIDRFYLKDTKPDLLKRSRIDFRQHNLKKRDFINSLLVRPDVIHRTDMSSHAANHSAPVITTVHDICPLVMPELFDPSKIKVFSLLLEQAVGESAAIITPSSRTKEDLISFMSADPDRVHVIREGADEIFVPQTNYQTGLIKARYSIKRPYILYVGALDDRKNIRGLLESYARISHESPPELVLAGNTGRMSEPLAGIISRLGLSGMVRHLGQVPKKALPALYSGAEIFVWPSLYEGFGLPVLEAMSCASPVISSASSSIPEVAGDAAILVDPADTGELAYSMRRVLNDPSLQQSMRERSLVQSAKFSVKNMARSTLDLYRKAAFN